MRFTFEKCQLKIMSRAAGTAKRLIGEARKYVPKGMQTVSWVQMQTQNRNGPQIQKLQEYIGLLKHNIRVMQINNLWTQAETQLLRQQPQSIQRDSRLEHLFEIIDFNVRDITRDIETVRIMQAALDGEIAKAQDPEVEF